MKLTIFLVLASALLVNSQEQSEWDTLFKKVLYKDVLPKAETLTILTKLKDSSENGNTGIFEYKLAAVERLLESSLLLPEYCTASGIVKVVTDIKLYKPHPNVHSYLEACLDDRVNYCMSSLEKKLLDMRERMDSETLDLIDKLALQFSPKKESLNRIYGWDFIVYQNDLAEFIVKILSSKFPDLHPNWKGKAVLLERIVSSIGNPCGEIRRELEGPAKFFNVVTRSKKLETPISDQETKMLVAYKVCIQFFQDSYPIMKLVKKIIHPKKTIWSVLTGKNKSNQP